MRANYSGAMREMALFAVVRLALWAGIWWVLSLFDIGVMLAGVLAALLAMLISILFLSRFRGAAAQRWKAADDRRRERKAEDVDEDAEAEDAALDAEGTDAGASTHDADGAPDVEDDLTGGSGTARDAVTSPVELPELPADEAGEPDGSVEPAESGAPIDSAASDGRPRRTHTHNPMSSSSE